MKTVLLTKLHQKCIDVLEVAKQAEQRRNHYIEMIVRHQMTTYQNELKLWPIGQPPREIAQHGLEISSMALERLNNYYNKLIYRINSQVQIKEYAA